MSKFLHISVAILFLVFAAVQYNDQDGWKWIFLYLMIALLAIHRLRRVKATPIIIGVTVAILLSLIFNAHQVTDWLNAGKPAFIDYEPTSIKEVEGIREYLGICISALAASFYTLLTIIRPIDKS